MQLNTSIITRKQLAGLLAPTARSKTILESILYWRPKASIRRFDQYWIAKTYNDYSEETGLSFDQAQRGIKDLCEIGLLIKKRMRFYNVTQTHVSFADGMEKRIESFVAELERHGDYKFWLGRYSKSKFDSLARAIILEGSNLAILQGYNNLAILQDHKDMAGLQDHNNMAGVQGPCITEYTIQNIQEEFTCNFGPSAKIAPQESLETGSQGDLETGEDMKSVMDIEVGNTGLKHAKNQKTVENKSEWWKKSYSLSDIKKAKPSYVFGERLRAGFNQYNDVEMKAWVGKDYKLFQQVLKNLKSFEVDPDYFIDTLCERWKDVHRRVEEMKGKKFPKSMLCPTSYWVHDNVHLICQVFDYYERMALLDKQAKENPEPELSAQPYFKNSSHAIALEVATHKQFLKDDALINRYFKEVHGYENGTYDVVREELGEAYTPHDGDLWLKKWIKDNPDILEECRKKWGDDD